jgi:hypothetical protein
MNRVTFFPRRPRTKWQRPPTRRLELELLEARNLLSFTNVLVNNPAEDTVPMQDTQSETAILLGTNSNIIVAYNDTGTFTYPNPLNPATVGYSLSADAGGSFKDEGQLPSGPPYWTGFDPVLAGSSKTGTIFLSTGSTDTQLSQVTSVNLVGDRVLIFRSLNNGKSYGAPINGTPGFVAGVDDADKEWMAVDNYPGPGYGNVYLAWNDYAYPGVQPNKGLFFTRSTDDGLDWGPSGGVPIKTPKANQAGINAHGAFVTVGPDHAVYVFWWDFTDGPTIRMRKSTDQGQTFGNEVIVTGLKTHGGNGDLGLTYSNTNSSMFRSNAYPQAAVNPVNGDIYLVYDDQPKGSADKGDIFFTMSGDGGNTWSKSIRVNDDTTTTDQWQPALALTPDGTHVFITWYDRRNDPTNDSLIDRYGVIGTISGHTVRFAPNFRITDISFPPAFGQDPLIDPTYMGDYDMATADNNYFYTTWGDNRLGDNFFANQPDVRFAEIPVGGESDPALVVRGAMTLAGTSATGPAGVGSLNDSASLLVGANSIAAVTPASSSLPPLAMSSDPNTAPAPVSPPGARIDVDAGRRLRSFHSRPTLAAVMKALDLAFADQEDVDLAGGLALAIIGS